MRVEVRRLGANADVEDAFAIAALDERFALFAAGGQNTEDRGQNTDQAREAHGQSFWISATACAAMARPRPMSSEPSFVVAFTPIASRGRPVDFAKVAFMSARRGAIFGFSAMSVASMLAGFHPRSRSAVTT